MLNGRAFRPWHRDSPLPLWLFTAVALLATFNIMRIAATPLDHDWPVDFRTLYLGQLLLFEGENPYDDDALKDAWRGIVADEGWRSLSLPGSPRTLLVYPPWALVLFSPFSLIGYRLAFVLWYLVIPILLAGTAWLLAGLEHPERRPVAFIDLLLLAIAFKATDWAFSVGQPMFLCLFFGILSWYLSRNADSVAAGVALGLAAFKPTLALPFVLLMAWRRRGRTLAVAVATGALLLGVFWVVAEDPSVAVAGLRDNLSDAREMVFSPDTDGYPLAFKMVTKTEITALAEYLVPGAHRYSGLLVVATLAMLGVLWRGVLRRHRATDIHVFLLFTVAALLTTHNMHYHCLALLPIYLLARQVGSGARVALLLSSAVFLLPISGIVTRLDPSGPLELLYFNVQFGLLALAVVLGRLRTV